MREILFRGKQVGNGQWVLGYYYKAKHYRSDTELCDYITIPHPDIPNEISDHIMVIPETVGQYTGLTDKNGTKIFEGDIVQYLTDYAFFDCQSIVKFGEYKQDGSSGEYGASDCIGCYVEVDNFTCPDWSDDPNDFEEFLKQQNILEVANKCEVIGNIHDNPELLK